MTQKILIRRNLGGYSLESYNEKPRGLSRFHETEGSLLENVADELQVLSILKEGAVELDIVSPGKLTDKTLVKSYNTDCEESEGRLQF